MFCRRICSLYNNLDMWSVFFWLGVACVCTCARVTSQPSSRCATPGLSAATLASLGGTSSRRGSTDTGSIYDPDTSLSELRVRCTQSHHSINMTDSSGWKNARIWIDNYATWNANPAWGSVCLHLVRCPTWICHRVSPVVSSSCSQCLD